MVEVGLAKRVFSVSLHQRFPGRAQTCKECAVNSFKMFSERGIFETICTLTTSFLNCTSVLFFPVVVSFRASNVVLKGVTVWSCTVY